MLGQAPRDVAHAIEDIRKRTLVAFPSEIAKLVWISSTRDYNTGRYDHDGVLSRYTPEITEAAFKLLHKEIFEQLVGASLEFLVHDLRTFFRLTLTNELTGVQVWKNIEPFLVVVPQSSDHLSRELFFSSVRMALSILANHQAEAMEVEQSSSPGQSHGQQLRLP